MPLWISPNELLNLYLKSAGLLIGDTNPCIRSIRRIRSSTTESELYLSRFDATEPVEFNSWTDSNQIRRIQM